MRTSLALALLLAAAAPAAAQQPPMPSGDTERAPRQHVVAEASDQIRASDAIGDGVHGPDGKKLGDIDDIYLSRDTGVVALAVVDGKPLAWNTLHFKGAPAPHFVADEAKSDVKNAAPTAIDKTRYIDVKQVRGKDVVGADGKKLGTLDDLVLRFDDGTPAALVVQTESDLEPVKTPRVVAWKDAKPQFDGKKVEIALGPDALKRSPEFATMAPDPTSGKDASGSTGATQPGTTLGTGAADPSVPAPATRRR
jgi:sporulation protein YlmC with PRC-barrel domain